jgi:dephospho-CoA kinase
MLKVGLTGGIGSGKTFVSNHFKKLGVPVIDTDLVARTVVSPGSHALKTIESTFGREVLDEHGMLDRKLLGKIVFSQPGKRAELEKILHPRIRQETLLKIKSIEAPYCIVVVPLLIETGFVDIIDRVLVVDAPEQNRIGWIHERDGLSDTEIQNVFNAQASREERLTAADYIIVNDGTKEELRSRVIDLHAQLLCDSENYQDKEKYR